MVLEMGREWKDDILGPLPLEAVLILPKVIQNAEAGRRTLSLPKLTSKLH